MEWLFDPTIWAGLLTLVVLEIVLGIDNLIFIAILADKLPLHQRDKARLIGLSLAMLMRLGLLTIVSWLVTLTAPPFALGAFSFSGRDLILLFPLNVFALSMSVASMQTCAVQGLANAGGATADATGAPDIQAMGDPDSDEPPAGYDFHDSVNEEGRLQPAALPGRSRPALLPPPRGLAPFPPIKPPPPH